MDVYIIGTASTPFRKWPERDFRDLAAEVVEGALGDAGLDDGGALEQIWFGNCAMHTWGQANIRGQVALGPLTRSGRLPERVPVVNVEGGCATGTLAFQGAVKDIASGQGALSLAVGVEKTWHPDAPATSFAIFQEGIDRRHPEEWSRFFSEQAERAGERFEPHPHRILFLDLHALQAKAHMKRHGLTREQLAAVASKNHYHGSLNPKAQFRFEVSVEQALADKPVIDPLTRSMCAPLSDGAAAVLLCSKAFLDGLPAEQRARAVRVRASVLAGGAWRDLEAPTVTRAAAEKAWRRSGLGPADVQVAEVHDATASCEVVHLEMLGLCPEGQGGAYSASGATRLDGERPVNPSGGLESKGHPLGATGLGQLDELVLQLRDEAGDRQVPGSPRVGLQHNAGGAIGFDEALAAVTLLERAS